MMSPLDQKELESLNTPHVSPPSFGDLEIEPSQVPPADCGGEETRGAPAIANVATTSSDMPIIDLGHDADSLIPPNPPPTNTYSAPTLPDDNALFHSPTLDQSPTPLPSSPLPPTPPPPQPSSHVNDGHDVPQEHILTPETAVRGKTHLFPHIVKPLKGKRKVLIGRKTINELAQETKRMPGGTDDTSNNNNETLETRHPRSLMKPSSQRRRARPLPTRPTDPPPPPPPSRHPPPPSHPPPTHPPPSHPPPSPPRSSNSRSRSPSPVYPTNVVRQHAPEKAQRHYDAREAAKNRYEAIEKIIANEKIKKVAAAAARRNEGKHKNDCPICGKSIKSKRDLKGHVVSFHSDSPYAEQLVLGKSSQVKVKQLKPKKNQKPSGDAAAAAAAAEGSSNKKKPLLPPKKARLKRNIEDKLKHAKESKKGGKKKTSFPTAAPSAAGAAQAKETKKGGKKKTSFPTPAPSPAGAAAADVSKDKVMSTTAKKRDGMDSNTSAAAGATTKRGGRGRGRGGGRGRGRGRGGATHGQTEDQAGPSSSGSREIARGRSTTLRKRNRSYQNASSYKRPKYDFEDDDGDSSSTTSAVDDKKRDRDYTPWMTSRRA